MSAYNRSWPEVVIRTAVLATQYTFLEYLVAVLDYIQFLMETKYVSKYLLLRTPCYACIIPSSRRPAER